MKASECWKKAGDVAWRVSNGAVAVYLTDTQCRLTHISGSSYVRHPDTLLGDDWEPLVPSGELERAKALEAENATLTKHLLSHLDGWESSATAAGVTIRDLQAENAKLRKQLAGQYVLGEPCKYQDIGNGNYYLARNRNNGKWRISQCFAFAVGDNETYDFWPWTPPTLPEPEPVPEVPKWKGVVRSSNSGVFMFVNEVSSRWLYGQLSDGFKSSMNVLDAEIFRGPVRWPDGSVKPIEPSPELIAALGEQA